MNRAILLYGVLLVFLNSCSTISVLPREGTAAKFNLATVEYVNAINQKQQEEFINQIIPKLNSILDSLLVEDRNTINELNSLMTEQGKKLVRLGTSLDSTNATIEIISNKFIRDLSDIKSANRSMQMYIDQLKMNIESLPAVTLRELNTALELYLNQKAQADTLKTTSPEP